MTPRLELPRVPVRIRTLSVLVSAVAVVAGSVVGAPAASAAVGVPVDYLDHTYTSTAPPSEDKPQSKLWFLDGSWWALMSGSGSSTTTIHQLMPDHTWRNTGTVVETRANSTGDALWSSRDNRLYVANRTNGSNLQVDTIAYNATADTWSVVSTATIDSGGGSESATIDQDSQGRLWVTYTRAARVWVAHSDTNRTAWTPGFQPAGLDTVIGTDDISALIAFGSGAGASVGVLYSDQESGGFHFAIHNDLDADTVWRDEPIAQLPGVPDARVGDDHINLKQLVGDAEGRIFAAIKTSANDSTTAQPADPLTGVLVRSSAGTWSFTEAGTVADDHTRPILMVDSTNEQLYFIATAPAGNIYYKKAPLSNIGALATQPGRGAAMIDVAPAVNNVTGSKDPVTGASGMVVVATAHSTSLKQYAHAEMALATGGMFDGQPNDPAPTVTATSPPSGATGVAVGADVSATFSEPVTGVSGTTFTLRDAGGATVPAAVTYDAATRTATLDPGATLAAGTTYTATLTAGIRDSASQAITATSWSFTTASASTDGTAPSVTARTPADGATRVGVSVNVTATFSEAVQGVSGTTFELRSPSGALIPAAVSFSSTTGRYTLNPNANLAPDTRYTATLIGGTAAIRDQAGNALTTTSWSFLTGPAPVVSSRSPGSGATGVSRTANVTATFSEAVQAVSSTTFTLRNAATGALVTTSVTKNPTSNQWILDPSVTLAANTRYTATVTGGLNAVRDLAGNPLTTASWTFTTGA